MSKVLSLALCHPEPFGGFIRNTGWEKYPMFAWSQGNPFSLLSKYPRRSGLRIKVHATCVVFPAKEKVNVSAGDDRFPDFCRICCWIRWFAWRRAGCLTSVSSSSPMAWLLSHWVLATTLPCNMEGTFAWFIGLVGLLITKIGFSYLIC